MELIVQQSIRYTQDDYARVLFTIELIMLKQHTLHISDELFSGLTLAQLLTLYAVVNLFSVYLIMYFVYDFMIWYGAAQWLVPAVADEPIAYSYTHCVYWIELVSCIIK